MPITGIMHWLIGSQKIILNLDHAIVIILLWSSFPHQNHSPFLKGEILQESF